MEIKPILYIIAKKKLHQKIEILNQEKFADLKNIMMQKNEKNEKREKILKGLELTYERLIAFKKRMNSELVIMKDHKIVKIKPEDL